MATMGYPPSHLEGLSAKRDSDVVLYVDGQDRNIVGNLGHWCDYWKTLRKLLRGTNDFMSQNYRIHGAL